MFWNDIVWHVGIRNRVGGLLDDSTPFHIIPNPKRKWAADPFLFTEQGRTYVFVELFCNEKHRGCIGMCEVKGNVITPYKIVIEEKYHMSYPYIWKDCDGIHLCAETVDNKSLHFYKPVIFPYKWENERILMTGKRWADTTFWHDVDGRPIHGLTYEYDDLWQAKMKLFQINGDEIEVSEEDFLSIKKPLQRCGGMFLCKGDRIYRVAQNGEHSYGHNIVFCDARLNWPYYTEEIIKEVKLDSIKNDSKINAIGVHTYNRTDMYEVVDFRSHEFHVDTFGYGIYRKIRNAGGKVKRKIIGKSKK